MLTKEKTHIVTGRITSAPSHIDPNERSTSARNEVIAAFNAAMVYAMEKGETVNSLVRGEAHAGFVMKGDKKVETVGDFNAMIHSLYRVNHVKPINKGQLTVYYFNVPAGYKAYSGLVSWDSLVARYMEKDQALKSAWEARLKAGYVLPEGEKPDYWEKEVEGTTDKWGPYMSILLSGTKLSSRLVQFQNPSGETVRKWASVKLNTNAPMWGNAVISFVVGSDQRLVNWCPGRWCEHGPTGGDRVVLSSGDVE